MPHSALTLSMQTLPHASSAATASLTGSDEARGGDAPSVEPAGRSGFGALHQILTSAQEIAVSADADVAAVELPSNPIDLSRWTVLFGAVNARIAAITALMATKDYWRSDLPDAESARTVMLECAQALAQLQTMFPLCRRELPLQQELADTRSLLALVQAELRESQTQERVARHVALHDALTSLPNRIYLKWHLKQALTDSTIHRHPVALFYVDLDGLKRVNDQHGHDAGDSILEMTALRLLATVPADSIVSRLGGDEFVCVLKGTDNRERLAALGKALIDAVSAELLVDGHRVSVRPSIGIAISQADGATPDTLLKHADAAMYRAKQTRTGYGFWDQH